MQEKIDITAKKLESMETKLGGEIDGMAVEIKELRAEVKTLGEKLLSMETKIDAKFDLLLSLLKYCGVSFL